MSMQSPSPHDRSGARSSATLARRTGRHSRLWSVILALGGCALVAAVFTSIRFGDLNAAIHGPPAIESSFESKADASVVLMGMGNKQVAPFHLTGGTYRVVWSAWGPAAEFPPC